MLKNFLPGNSEIKFRHGKFCRTEKEKKDKKEKWKKRSEKEEMRKLKYFMK